MLVSVLLLTLSDALTKLLSTGYPPGQIICMRSLIVIGFVLVLSTPRRRWTGLRIRSPAAHFTRGVFACAGSLQRARPALWGRAGEARVDEATPCWSPV